MIVKAKKNLGQHFLRDEHIAHRIAETIDIRMPGEENSPGLPVLEIGPGMGVLTKYLIQSGRPVKCVELDSESVEYLHRYYPGLDVIEADFLQLNLDEIFETPFAIIGNYPYNISSQIFFKVLDYKDKIPIVAGMLQKEVAQRICSGPGGKVYGILSVLLQAWYDCEYLFTVPPDVFSPPPKVQSGVLRLVRNSRTELGCDERLFKTIVKTSFGQRRKTLRNSIGSILGEKGMAITGDLLSLRPERLGVEDFIRLTLAAEKNKPAPQE